MMTTLKPTRWYGWGLVVIVGLKLALAPATHAAVLITSPTVRDGAFVLIISSSVGQSYTLQAAEDVLGPWREVTNRMGTGGPLEFSDVITFEQKFYRVLTAGVQAFDFSPGAPLLPSSAVSLPDAVAGSAYAQDIKVEHMGSGSFTVQVTGALPSGVSAAVASNGPATATVRLTADGTGLIADERREFSVLATDTNSQTASRLYNIRVVAPPPVIQSELISLKAGEPANVTLQSIHGTGPVAWSALPGNLPDGLTLANDGRLSGTPSADAAETDETGLFTIQLQVSDSHTDRVTGAPSPRVTTKAITLRVRLSYRLNILADRVNSPALTLGCAGCHSAFFPPDISSGTAIALIDVTSRVFGSCRDQPYIEPGSPGDSLLLKKVKIPNCGEQMPQGGPFLDEIQLQRLERWIRELTYDDMD